MLNHIISAFDLAEWHAMNHGHMYKQDWLPQVDDFAKPYGKGVLQNAGTVSRQAAIEKATEKYRKYCKQVADFPSTAEQDYLDNLKQTQKKLQGMTGGERE
ncbi:conserved hypothetical protein [uncultured Eubacteriales bacterium]|uniref:Virulence protein n=1 Tax=uncultured Eubacteriales bacterium TaxID=172733 RepID=A0A212JBZ0_9FIRM|nr:conserved hypothetical protein [uncultured Eubacteriales bacterium]